MRKTFIRGAAVTAGALLALAGVATPAAAEEIVPSGCVGSFYYACTGTARPLYSQDAIVRVPVHAEIPATPLVPAENVPGMTIGGYVLTLGGEITEEQTFVVGGPIGPFATGLTMPIAFCGFVTCYQAGDPVIIPGANLPFIPVVVPGLTTQQVTVPVPYVTSVPGQQTPEVGVPATDLDVVTVTVVSSYDDVDFASRVCVAGRGQPKPAWPGPWRCEGGDTAELANLLYLLAEYV